LFFIELIGDSWVRNHLLGILFYKNLERDSGACPGLDPGFAGVTSVEGAWFFVVIPAEAGIQDHEKIKSMSSLLWPH
jgi:hypothetical protein